MVIVAARESEKRKSSTKVADLMMRQRALGLKPQSPDNYQQTEILLREVIKQEPDNAYALASLAAVLAIHAANFLDEANPRFRPMVTEAKELALRAKAIDDQLPGVYSALAIHAGFIDKDVAEVRRDYEKGIEVAPKAPSSYNNLSAWYYDDGQAQKSIDLLNKALALYPRGNDTNFSNLARGYFMLGDNAAAIEWGQRAVDRGIQLTHIFTYLAMAHANLGQMDKAHEYANEYKRRMEQTGRNAAITKLEGTESPAWVTYYNERYLPAWRKAGLPE
jgi:tetratricopeptide (TPR) repeat protein